jgi:hypothetical protein
MPGKGPDSASVSRSLSGDGEFFEAAWPSASHLETLRRDTTIANSLWYQPPVE